MQTVNQFAFAIWTLLLELLAFQPQHAKPTLNALTLIKNALLWTPMELLSADA